MDDKIYVPKKALGREPKLHEKIINYTDNSVYVYRGHKKQEKDMDVYVFEVLERLE